MKLPFFAAAAIVASGLVLTSCLPRDASASSNQKQELEAKVTRLESEVASLKADLAAAETAKATAEAALTKATTATERAVADAAKRSAAELTAAREQVAALRNASREAEERHQAQVADFQQQIKAIALKSPTGDAPAAIVEPGTPKRVAAPSIQRHISPGQ